MSLNEMQPKVCSYIEELAALECRQYEAKSRDAWHVEDAKGFNVVQAESSQDRVSNSVTVLRRPAIGPTLSS